jgi:hypothetical protein
MGRWREQTTRWFWLWRNARGERRRVNYARQDERVAAEVDRAEDGIMPVRRFRPF